MVNENLKIELSRRLADIEKIFGCDVFVYYGAIIDGLEVKIARIIEYLHLEKKHDKLLIIINTPGGSIIAVERYVNIVRHHYKEVEFLIPNYAYSAGTIFCMSGDKIWMNYLSVLGPIDPQVGKKDGGFVPALGYLDKYNDAIKKSKNNTLTELEYLLIRELDLSEINRYQILTKLTIDLLKKWLVNYKFKNWDKHRSNNIGKEVTILEKNKRAADIARKLGDNKIWKDHSRPINKETLEKELKLEIDDFYIDVSKKYAINSYCDEIEPLMGELSLNLFIHTRNFISI